jgi:hypothetical protein
MTLDLDKIRETLGDEHPAEVLLLARSMLLTLEEIQDCAHSPNIAPSAFMYHVMKTLKFSCKSS